MIAEMRCDKRVREEFVLMDGVFFSLLGTTGYHG